MDAYNVVWASPSRDASESMPCGGGDIGLNVWVENGDVLFYLSRSGSLDELNEYLKLGRVRLRLDPNPFAAGTASFRQELVLREGHVEIRSGDVLVRVWVEVHRPIVHVEVESSREISVTAAYENWRLTEEILTNDTRRHACMELSSYPGEVRLSPDTVAHADGGVLFFHRNPAENWLRRLQIEQQGLQAFCGQIPDDLSNRTFGGFMAGEGFQPAGETTGVYQTRAYKGWQLRSEKPARRQHLRICTHIAQTETLASWQTGLMGLVNAPAAGREATVAWWREFWARSWIAIQPDKPDAGSRAWRIGRNYNLFRYQLGCNAFGEYPSKFNGGSFTFDANLVGEAFRLRGPDWRQWGGGVFTAQNQRLLYWPMLKAGDAEVILPQFELYRKALPGAQARVKANFGHEGAVYSEYIGVPGLALGCCYGWASGQEVRGPDLPFGDPRANALHHYGDPVEKGVMAAMSISYHWESQLEHAYMILEYHRFTGADLSAYIPFIENAVVFFDQHYRKREELRSGRQLDENGHLVIYPSKACESFRGATNPADVIAGLDACVEGILTLDDALLTLRDKAFYRALKAAIPPYAYSEAGEGGAMPRLKDIVPGAEADEPYARPGVRTILPARSWNKYGSGELPMLYPLFPFNRFALGRDDMQVFRDTYEHGHFRKGRLWSWHQDGIFFARMGQTEKAADFNARKLDDSERRFPTFWGPGHDWVPDHNWGGSGMIGLQEMLMQTIGSEIRLLPAWPLEWDVDFKLHAPGQTVVTGRVRNGQLVDLDVQPESRRKDVVVSSPWGKRPCG
jgi:hypothetical protein